MDNNNPFLIIYCLFIIIIIYRFIYMYYDYLSLLLWLLLSTPDVIEYVMKLTLVIINK